MKTPTTIGYAHMVRDHTPRHRQCYTMQFPRRSTFVKFDWRLGWPRLITIQLHRYFLRYFLLAVSPSLFLFF